MIVRRVTAEDKEAVFQLANQLHEKITIDKATYNEAFSNILKKKDQLLFVAESKAKIVGYFSANIHIAIYANGKVLYLDEIVVDKNYRGRNIGNTLMTELEQQAFKNNCKLIALATGGSTEFYFKIGYNRAAGYYKKYL